MEYSTRERRYDRAGVDAAESSIVRLRQKAFWAQDFSTITNFKLDVEKEAWALENEARENYITLSIEKIKPRLKHIFGDLIVGASLLGLKIDRKPGLYTAWPTDTDDSFILPALDIKLKLSRWFFSAAYWKEYDIITLDGDQYTVILTDSTEIGGGVEFTQNQTLALHQKGSQRSYPEGLEFDREDYSLTYKYKSPFSRKSDPWWQALSLQVSDNTFPVSGDKYREIEIDNQFKFTTGKITNFLTYRLTYTDSYAAYNRGSSEDSIVEDNYAGDEFIQYIRYEGFQRLGGSPWFLAWGLHVEDSLTRNSFVETSGHIKVTLTY